MIYSIGLTGNIGTGKSSVLDLFQRAGSAVISADQIARQITGAHEPVLEIIQDHFKNDLMVQDGILNRPKLRERILESQADKIWLEALLHPLIRERIKNQLKTVQGPYCVIEIPLLYHREDYPYLNRILLVQASPAIQIQRVTARDHCTREQAEKMLALQRSDAERLKIADDVLNNNDTIQQCEVAVKKLDEQYRAAALSLSTKANAQDEKQE